MRERCERKVLGVAWVAGLTAVPVDMTTMDSRYMETILEYVEFKWLNGAYSSTKQSFHPSATQREWWGLFDVIYCLTGQGR